MTESKGGSEQQIQVIIRVIEAGQILGPEIDQAVVVAMIQAALPGDLRRLATRFGYQQTLLKKAANCMAEQMLDSEPGNQPD